MHLGYPLCLQTWELDTLQVAMLLQALGRCEDR